uniref:Uncharacterized protein n=1 Tax=Gossypium raimondii TaxID=29730 RepID=A0A0D2U8X5_GOSRA|nr:hypothetical protein B456_010G046300 [Gossypium raimondii]
MVTEESREVETQGQYINGMCSDHHVSQDFISGIMKIVPSDLDNDADYCLLSDPSVSITDIWRTECIYPLYGDTLRYIKLFSLAHYFAYSRLFRLYSWHRIEQF